MPTITQNIESLLALIQSACQRSGRDPEGIKLVVVSKTATTDQVEEAYSCGIRDFGENRVALASKQMKAVEHLKDIKWHMIGHLQTNKVKDAVDLFSVIHSVDSQRLAKEVNDRAAFVNKVMPVLLEINVSGEESKYGISPSMAGQLISEIKAYKNLELLGLMTMAPYDEDPEKARPFFSHLKNIAVEHGLRHLSMGMSGDFEVAIEEGATIIRVGTSIFATKGAVL